MLSPLLFSLFINDIEECLDGGGVLVGSKRVKLLAFADDIVLLASEPQTLQRMINSLCNYTQLWNLKINMKKSKIIVFRNGGRPAKREKWFCHNEVVETVNEYKYLGVTLTSRLSFVKHIKSNVSKAKEGLN